MLTLSSPASPAMRLGARSLTPLALLALMAVTAAAGVAVLLWQPAQERLAAADAAYVTSRQQQGRQKAIRKTVEDLAAVWKELPARTEFPALILAVSELAQHDQVVIPGMSYTVEPVEHQRVLKASMTFRVAGAYPAIRRFLHRIETMNSYVVIESLNASRDREGHGVEFSIRAVTFLRPEPAAGDKAV